MKSTQINHNSDFIGKKRLFQKLLFELRKNMTFVLDFLDKNPRNILLSMQITRDTQTVFKPERVYFGMISLFSCGDEIYIMSIVHMC